MLGELARIHDDLLEAISATGRATAAATPDRALVAAARLALVQANGRRRRFVAETVQPALLAIGSPRAIEAVRRLRAQEAEMFRAATAFVARWTMDAVVADWPGYQQACAAMRAAIRDRILTERALIVPLLSPALSSSAGSPSGRSTSPRLARAAGMPRLLPG